MAIGAEVGGGKLADLLAPAATGLTRDEVVDGRPGDFTLAEAANGGHVLSTSSSMPTKRALGAKNDGINATFYQTQMNDNHASENLLPRREILRAGALGATAVGFSALGLAQATQGGQSQSGQSQGGMNNQGMQNQDGMNRPMMNQDPMAGAAADLRSDPRTQARNTREWQRNLGQFGLLSLTSAEAGLQKATNADARMFAQFEATEQRAVAEILREQGVPTPSLDARSRPIVTAHEAATGAEFDRVFAAAQLDTHQRLLALMNSHIDNVKPRNAADREARHLAIGFRPAIIEHIAHSRTLMGMVGAPTGTVGGLLPGNGNSGGMTGGGTTGTGGSDGLGTGGTRTGGTRTGGGR